MSDCPYNPLERRPLAESVANALLVRAKEELPPEQSFSGAGIYALYYSGDFEPYQAVLEAKVRKTAVRQFTLARLFRSDLRQEANSTPG